MPVDGAAQTIGSTDAKIIVRNVRRRATASCRSSNEIIQSLTYTSTTAGAVAVARTG